MRCLRQFGVVVLLLLSYVAPVMACMRADARMSASERACCRMMKGNCGQMEMPASHGCCHKAPNISQPNALRSKTAVIYPTLAFAVHILAVDRPSLNETSATWTPAPQSPPPESPPRSISVLKV